MIARLTWSRGSSSSTNRSPCTSRISAPSPRSASLSRGRGCRSMASAVGWNCTNSMSATATPARSAMATPSAVASMGLVVTAKSCPAPPLASSVWVARISTGAPSGPTTRTPTQRPRSTSRSSTKAALFHPDGSVVHGLDQGPLDLDAGRHAAGVDHTGEAMAALPGEVEVAVGTAVEHRAHRDQVAHRPRALLDEGADRLDVAETATRAEGVGHVELGGVDPGVEHGGDPALRPAGGGRVDAGLGDDGDREPVPAGRPHGGGEPGHARADHQQVDAARRGGGAHVGQSGAGAPTPHTPVGTAGRVGRVRPGGRPRARPARTRSPRRPGGWRSRRARRVVRTPRARPRRSRRR